MRRKLLENEKIIKKWGQLVLTSHRLWIESGDDDNYFLNSIELHQIQGHSIVKYSNKSYLTLALMSFFISPVSVLLLKFGSKEFSTGLDNHEINWILLATGLSFLLVGANFIWKFQSTRSLTLNFQGGSRNIYFRLSGEFARIETALEYSNLVDAQINNLNIKTEDVATVSGPEHEKTRTFKIS